MIRHSKDIRNKTGNNLLIRLIKNLTKEKFLLFLYSIIICWVIKKPDITKKISTPKKPPVNKFIPKNDNFAWYNITLITAIALNPSISGL